MDETSHSPPSSQHQDQSYTKVIFEKILRASRNFKSLFTQYLCEGQNLKKNISSRGGSSLSSGDTSFLGLFVNKHKTLIGITVPVLIVHSVWWYYMISNNEFGIFEEKCGSQNVPRYYLTIAMIFGSFLAGATSEGGGAVAFPVLTLAFAIDPSVARDFCFMIQCVGMVSAAGIILWMGILVEWTAILYCSVGGVGGVVMGLRWIDLEASYSKMYFVVIWASFATALFYLNRKNRKVYLLLNPPQHPDIWKDGIILKFNKHFNINWKACVLIVTGFIGGIFSSFSGSGIDICSFAVLTLLFRVSEKTATPTSVVLMAGNSLVGCFYREYGQRGLEPEAWKFFFVCAPVVCIGAPLGSVIGSYAHRLVLAWGIYITDTAQLIVALCIIQPWEKTDKPGHGTPVHLTVSSSAIFVGCLALFFQLKKAGEKLLNRHTQIETKDVSSCAVKVNKLSSFQLKQTKVLPMEEGSLLGTEYNRKVTSSSSSSEEFKSDTSIDDLGSSGVGGSDLSDNQPILATEQLPRPTDLTTYEVYPSYSSKSRLKTQDKQNKELSMVSNVVESQVPNQSPTRKQNLKKQSEINKKIHDNNHDFNSESGGESGMSGRDLVEASGDLNGFFEFLSKNKEISEVKAYSTSLGSRRPREMSPSPVYLSSTTMLPPVAKGKALPQKIVKNDKVSRVYMGAPPDWMGQALSSSDDDVESSHNGHGNDTSEFIGAPPDWMGQPIREPLSDIAE